MAKNIIEICYNLLKKYNYIYFTDEEFSLLNDDAIEAILNELAEEPYLVRLIYCL